MCEHEAAIVDRALRVEKHDAAPPVVAADMREQRHRRTWAKAPHEVPRATALEVRRPIPGLHARAQRRRARALPGRLVVAVAAASQHQRA
jgi:hypothetical protein